MLQRFVHRDAFPWVEHEHLVDQLNRQRISARVETSQGDAGSERKRPDVAPCFLRLNEVEVGLVGRTDDADDELELVDVVFPGEERLSA